jgi:hypothetical protein
MLIDAEMPWRTIWLTYGLYNDGWMLPGMVARIRVYGDPKQHGDATRTLTFQAQSPTNIASEHFTVGTNLGTTQGTAVSDDGTFTSVSLCLPRHGFAEARITAPQVGTIPGDLDSLEGSEAPRRGSLLLSNLSIADEVGAPCHPARR